MTPVKQKEEGQSKVTPTKTSPCKVDNEAVAKEAKGAPTVEKAKVPKAKAKAKAGTKDTSKADHGGDNATEAGVAPKRKASNGAADSEAPKKRPAAKGHRSRARIPVPATANEATTMEVEPKLEPELEPEVSGDAFGATGPKLAGADPEVSEVSGVAEVPGVPVPVLEEEATPMELDWELPEVVSEVAGGFEVSGLATFDFDSVDNTSGGGAAAGTVDDSSQGEGAAGDKPSDLTTSSESIPQQLSQCQKKPELHGQEAPVTPVNALEAQHSWRGLISGNHFDPGPDTSAQGSVRSGSFIQQGGSQRCLMMTCQRKRSLLHVIAQAQQMANSSGLVCRGSSTSWPQKMSACVRQREQLGSM